MDPITWWLLFRCTTANEAICQSIDRAMVCTADRRPNRVDGQSIGSTRTFCVKDNATCRKIETAAYVTTLEHVNNTEAWKMDRRQTRPTVRKILYAAANRIELWLFTSIVRTNTVRTTLPRGVYDNRPKESTTTTDGCNDGVERDKVSETNLWYW